MSYNLATKTITPNISLISAILIHGSVEIPFFIFPAILLLVGENLFPNLGDLSWIGLGSLGTIGTLAAGLPSPLFGRLADKYHKGTLMLVSLIFAALGALIIGLFGESYLVMLLGVVLLGSSLALYHPAGLSWISTVFEDPKTQSFSSHYVRILAVHGIGGSVGSSIGPISVFFLIDILTWRNIYLIWVIPLSLLAIVFWILIGRHEPHSVEVPPISRQEEPIKGNNEIAANNFQNSILLLTFIFIITMSLTRGMINFILATFLSEVKNFEISTAALYIGLSALIGSTGQVIGGIFGDKYGEKVVLSFTAVFQAVILIGIFIFNDNLVLLLLYILLGVMNALFWPSTNSLVAKNSAKRGRAFGWVMLVANFVGALGPSIDGFLRGVDPNQYTLIFCFAIFFSICGFISFLFLKNSNTIKEKSYSI
ncbi:MAG: MFS transporter [Candidatus Heimdallarchaeota archaeon]|nr:MAG: MFS transporter [Candidatus Heimdallarchaeota archaeon]